MPPPRSHQGFSLVEVLATLSLFSILSALALGALKELDDPLQDGASQLVSFFKQVRAQAISSTLAYTVSASSSNTIQTAYAVSCKDTVTTPDPQIALTLPSEINLADTSWSFCFSSRGLADSNVLIHLIDNHAKVKTIEILLGGAVRVL